MKQRIAIEPNLTPVKDFLSDKGYTVDSINFGQGTHKYASEYDAYVVSGMDSNFLGIHDTSTKAVVIDASGLTPQQVLDEIKTRLQS